LATAAEGLFHDVHPVCFEDELKLPGQEAEVGPVDGLGKQQLELFSQAFLQRFLALVKGLLDLDELGDGLEI
jgi:hypothetical protein